MKFTVTVRMVIECANGANALGIANDLLKQSGLKHEVITISAGDKI